MNATIQKSQRSILADEPTGGFDHRVDRASVPLGRAPRPNGAMIATALVIVVSAAALGWSMLGDSGAQLVETETASPAPTLPQAAAVVASGRSSGARGALAVDVAGLDGDRVETTDASSTNSSSTEPTAATESTAEAATSSTGSTAGSSTVAGSATKAAVQAAESSTSTAGSSTGATMAPTTAGRSSAGSGPTSTPTSNSTSMSTSTSTSMSTSTSRPPSTTQVPAAGSAWEEHFNGLDTSRWQIEHSTYGDGNGERQCYQPDNVRVANGRLVLTAKAETATCPNGSTRTVTSGMVRSRGLTFSPGQTIEFRVKLTPLDPSNQAGLWPAVWASGWAGSWPRGGELDFLEVMTAEDPGRAMFSMHYADRSGGHELQNKAVPMAGHFSDGWHTIRFDYGRNGNLAWFLDGTKVFAVSSAATAQGYPAPFDQTIHEIKLNLAVGGTPGPLASGALGTGGATFEIDYIKVSDL